MSWSEDTADRTIWGEARGEGEAGMRAVAHVLVNRLNSGRWGSTLAEVCLWPLQFSCWNASDPNRKLMAALGEDDVLLSQISGWLDAALAGEDDPTGGATHYYAESLAHPPAWVAGARFEVQIGRHRFYSGVN